MMKDAQIGSNLESDEDAQNIKQATQVIQKHNAQLSRALGIRVGLQTTRMYYGRTKTL